MSKLLETAPADVAARVAAVVLTDEDVLVLVSTDIAEDGACYGERWLALTAQRLVLLTSDDESVCIRVDEMWKRKRKSSRPCTVWSRDARPSPSPIVCKRCGMRSDSSSWKKVESWKRASRMK